MNELSRAFEIVEHHTTRGIFLRDDFRVHINYIYFESTAIRMFARDGAPWFALPDACEALGLGDSEDIMDLVTDDERMAAVLPSPGGYREVLAVVSLSGLYGLLDASPLPASAAALWQLVTTQLLPTLALLDQTILLPPRADERFTSTSDLATAIGMTPVGLGRRARHLKTPRHGEMRPALGTNSDRPVAQWWWNPAGRKAVLREFASARRRRQVVR
jgi:hypothetical protein